ncbi:hypothetical protein LPJ72_000710, partial [Coemansia sp. Benny D160-2]
LRTAISDRRLDANEAWSFPDPFVSAINHGLAAADAFSLHEAELALLELEADNRLMFRDNLVLMM